MITKLKSIFLWHQFLQKLRETSIISEKSSTLPRSMKSMSSHLATCGKRTYEPPGPT